MKVVDQMRSEEYSKVKLQFFATVCPYMEDGLDYAGKLLEEYSRFFFLDDEPPNEEEVVEEPPKPPETVSDEQFPEGFTSIQELERIAIENYKKTGKTQTVSVDRESVDAYKDSIEGGIQDERYRNVELVDNTPDHDKAREYFHKLDSENFFGG